MTNGCCRFILGYGGSKTVLQLYGSGSGGVAEFQKNLKNEILYGYIRVSYPFVCYNFFVR